VLISGKSFAFVLPIVGNSLVSNFGNYPIMAILAIFPALCLSSQPIHPHPLSTFCCKQKANLNLTAR
jgi:hypothetical protein